MFVTNWISTTKIQKISEITNFFRHYFLSRTEVTSIGDRTFFRCSSLSSLVIPKSVTSIGEGAFRDCNFPDNLKQELISRFGDKIFG